MVAEAVKTFGGLDVMVNNAGFTHKNQPMLDVTEEEFDRIFAVNVKAIYLAALACVPEMEKRGGGVIINTASTAGLRPRPGLTWYNGSKGAAITLSKSMAAELGPKKIRVCAICPVIGETRHDRAVHGHARTRPRTAPGFWRPFPWAASPSPPTSPTPRCSWPRPRAA